MTGPIVAEESRSQPLKSDERALIPEPLAPFATRFEFIAGDLTFTIERYDNHGRLLPDGAWCVGCWFTRGDLPNVHYLGNGGWRYKVGATYPTLAEAWEAYQVAEPPS